MFTLARGRAHTLSSLVCGVGKDQLLLRPPTMGPHHQVVREALAHTPSPLSAGKDKASDEDKALNFTCDPEKPFVPTAAIRSEVASAVLKQVGTLAEPSICYEYRGGGISLSKEGVGARCFAFCRDFGECGCHGCGCNRLQNPNGRRRFREMVVARTESDVARNPVRFVTIGAGNLLTDFEILLGLWQRGMTIESIVAIDSAYTNTNAPLERDMYHRSLSAIGIFFSPARVTAFGSGNDYVAAAKAKPSLYANANLFLYCDAGAVPREVFTSCAIAALAPGHRAFELANSGGRGHGGRSLHDSPCIDHLPRELRPVPDKQRNYSMTVFLHDKSQGTSELVPVHEPLIDQERDVAMPWDAFKAAKTHLEQTARQRAGKAGERLFKVVYSKSRVPLRQAPTRSAEIVGSRSTGDEIIVDEMHADGWVRLSPLDTWLGWDRYGDAIDGKAPFMLTSAPDVGEILREVLVDENGDEIDDDAWLPEMM